MPVLAKFGGIVIRMLVDRTFGTHLHALYGDSELVIGLNPLRVIQGEAPGWVREWALDWVKVHQDQLHPPLNGQLRLATTMARDTTPHSQFERVAAR